MLLCWVQRWSTQDGFLGGIKQLCGLAVLFPWPLASGQHGFQSWTWGFTDAVEGSREMQGKGSVPRL